MKYYHLLLLLLASMTACKKDIEIPQDTTPAPIVTTLECRGDYFYYEEQLPDTFVKVYIDSNKLYTVTITDTDTIDWIEMALLGRKCSLKKDSTFYQGIVWPSGNSDITLEGKLSEKELSITRYSRIKESFPPYEIYYLRAKRE